MAEHDTRQKILDSASRLFHNSSYTGVGVAVICKSAGVSKGSFFHFFRSKQDVALAVLERSWEQYSIFLSTSVFNSERAPLERLDALVESLYVFQSGQASTIGIVPGCPYGNLGVELATQNDMIRLKVDYILSSISENLRIAVSDAVKCGALPPLDQAATALGMMAYIEGLLLMAKVKNDPEVIRILGPGLKSIHIPLKA